MFEFHVMHKNKFLWLVSACWLAALLLTAQPSPQKTTYAYAQRDGIDLKLDIYQTPGTAEKTKPCIVFVFGGGFKEGTRDNEIYGAFFRHFSEKGFVVASIDYRLGLKGIAKAPSPFNQQPLSNAIQMAVEDLYAATAYLLENAANLHIDTASIIIGGSSAGAITVLQADYQKRNAMPPAEILPSQFQYAGVMSFAGGIYSTRGTPAYAVAPAPTLFFHGSSDKLVPYDKIRFFNKGMFGSKTLARKFKKSGYPYCFFSMEGIGHEVSEYPMADYLPEIEQFIQYFVIAHKRQYIDVNIKDDSRKSSKTVSPKDYYQ